MKRKLRIYGCTAFLFASATAFAATSPKIITGPNYYYFTSSTYTADPGATNAVIGVSMNPGSPAWSGSVDYATQNGTGKSGQDYTTVSGTIWFSGPSPRGFNVPIQPGPVEKTVSLSLTNPTSGAVTVGSATLIIPAAPPSVALRRDTNSCSVSWDARYTNYVVEINTNLANPSWVATGGTPVGSNGRYVLNVPGNRPFAFFRLRQQ